MRIAEFSIFNLKTKITDTRCSSRAIFWSIAIAPAGRQGIRIGKRQFVPGQEDGNRDGTTCRFDGAFDLQKII
jgi:hypothetical protein